MERVLTTELGIINRLTIGSLMVQGSGFKIQGSGFKLLEFSKKLP